MIREAIILTKAEIQCKRFLNDEITLEELISNLIGLKEQE